FCFDFFFTEPLYTLELTWADIPALLILIVIAILVTRFSAVRRKFEKDLREARDKLQVEVEERAKQSAQLQLLNEELAESSTELAATNKELEAFAYSVSHDLRAPLRHVAGYTELLQKQAGSLLNEKCTRYMAAVLESAKKMGSLIDDLLSFSRVGRAEAQKT